MRQKRTPRWLIVVYGIGMLLTGTLNTLTTKIQFSTYSIDSDGNKTLFQKPWFGTMNMMAAMATVLLADQLVNRCSLCSKPDRKAAMLLDGVQKENGHSTLTFRQKVLMVAVPAALDLLATALACTGILYLPASVWQMLRGASLVFTALFSITFLKRRMFGWHWLGLCLCVIGVIVVGLANVLGTSDSSSDTPAHGGSVASFMFGMLLVLSAQVAQAAQVIAEEYLMKDVDLPGLQIIGFEGVWGVLFMVVLVYPALYLIPGSDHGSQEDILDTYVMFSNSTMLQGVIMLYLFSCATFNVTGIALTGALSSVHRTMLDATRTVVIWAFGLYVHYYVDDKSLFGEKLTPYSHLQLVAFVVLVTGQATYGEVLKMPFFKYPPAPLPSPHASPHAAINFASPLPPLRDGDAEEIGLDNL